MNARIADQTFDAEEYAALARALGWIEGFGAFFVECSPAQGRALVTQLTDQLAKRCQLVELQSEIKDLRQYILHLPNYQAIQVLFIIGLEKSFEPYIKAGYGGEGDYYKEDTPVPVLGRLNLDREVLCRDLPQLAVVFMLPRYGTKYFIRRAPDFFDWRSGWFHFATEKSLLSSLIAEKTEIDLGVYSQQSVTERQARLLELADLSEEPAQTDEEKAKLYQEMGIILYSLERYEEAIASYDKAVAINPNDDWAWVFRGIMLGGLERYEEAIASYDKAIAINPNHDEAWNNRGNALGELGRYEEAIASYDKAIAVNPNFDLAWHNRGNALGELGRYEEAIASHDNAIAINPNHDEAWYERGYSLNELGRYEEAIASYDKAIAINPNHDWAWCQRGDSLRQLGRNEEAIANYDKAVVINPNNDWAWYRRGSSLSELGRYEEAIASYDKSVAINPYHYDLVWNDRCDALGELGRNEEAIASCDKAIAINPNHDEAWYRRGAALGELGRYEEVITSCDKAITINPNHDRAWYNRGIALSQLGRYEEAIASHDNAIAINPNHDWAWYRRGYSLSDLGRNEEAIASFDKAVAINPNHDWAWNKRCIALWKQGKLSDAANSFAKALEVAPNNLSALSNDIELALVQQDFSRMQQRLAVALPLLQPDTDRFIILSFLQWLAAPQTSPQFILDAIRRLEPTVKIDWDFSTTQPALDRLTPTQQTIAYAFIDFFKNQCDFTTLQQRLNATYSDPK